MRKLCTSTWGRHRWEGSSVCQNCGISFSEVVQLTDNRPKLEQWIWVLKYLVDDAKRKHIICKTDILNEIIEFLEHKGEKYDL